MVMTTRLMRRLYRRGSQQNEGHPLVLPSLDTGIYGGGQLKLSRGEHEERGRSQSVLSNDRLALPLQSLSIGYIFPVPGAEPCQQCNTPSQ